MEADTNQLSPSIHSPLWPNGTRASVGPKIGIGSCDAFGLRGFHDPNPTKGSLKKQRDSLATHFPSTSHEIDGWPKVEYLPQMAGHAKLRARAGDSKTATVGSTFGFPSYRSAPANCGERKDVTARFGVEMG